MTSNISGIPAAPASTPPETAPAVPALRVVTPGGDTTIPRVVLEASADRALADYEAGLRARLDAAVQSIEIDRDKRETAAQINGTIRRGNLVLLADTPPERRVTECTRWCIVDHTDRHEGGDYHYGHATEAGPVSLRLDIDACDRATVEIATEHADGDNLTLTDMDELIAALIAARAELAETIAQRTALAAAGGAA